MKSYIDIFNLEGKVAVITGGATGLGFSMAQCLAGANATVVLVGRREEELEHACREIGERAHYIRCDITDFEGIPVLVERSSYESHPLGRMEWIKLYGALLGKDELAKACFQEQVKNLEAVMNQQPTGKTAAFFYISSNGYVNVRKSGDYVAKIIQLAGGSYVPENLEENENALSTMNMQMEAFYAAAREADYLIYNSTVDGQLYTLEQLLDKSSILADFKAVKQGHVWCTEKNLFHYGAWKFDFRYK